MPGAIAVAMLLLLATAAVPALAAIDDVAVRCQSTIEAGGRRLMTVATDVVGACAGRLGRDPALCMDRLLKRATVRVRRSWARKVKRRCAGVEVAHDLGYLGACVSPAFPLNCNFAVKRLAAPGKRNDVLDCLDCEVVDRVRSLALVFLPTVVRDDRCQQAVETAGLATLRGFVDELGACLARPDVVSISACLSDPDRRARLDDELAGLRAAAESGCAGTDPFAGSGYLHTCARVPPDVPPLCGGFASVCNHPFVQDLDRAGDADDLLDCFTCQVEEAAVGLRGISSAPTSAAMRSVVVP